MDRVQFLSEIGLGHRMDLRTAEHIPTRIRWIMPGNGAAGFTASARLDYSEDFAQIEFGIYEHVAGESSYMSGRAEVDAERGAIDLSIDAAWLFDRFCETVRLMELDELTFDSSESGL
ncbi:hypothetical protein AB4Y43_17050 [Paraburkholderia sp. BR10872]|uniref:hypothetical protein n=1 Tax=Paraburkholderia sp. BR10872 TaxID=3236989 RepID=UPI0034D1EBF5